MSILLTGGAGYIGSHTCVELVKAGFSVVIADDFSNSKPEVLRRIERITQKNIPFYPIDVADKTALDDLFSKEPIEAVVHFAGFKAESTVEHEGKNDDENHDDAFFEQNAVFDGAVFVQLQDFGFGFVGNGELSPVDKAEQQNNDGHNDDNDGRIH